jgi:hypothetical protein
LIYISESGGVLAAVKAMRRDMLWLVLLLVWLGALAIAIPVI